jgi:predicted acylesterase/phospholipase RssA
MPYEAPGEPVELSPTYLAGFPALAGLDADSLRPLADALVLQRFEDGHVFFRGEWPAATEPLRLLVHGRIASGSKLGRERAGAWSLKPGALLGVDSVAAWARVEGSERAPGGLDATATGVVWVLELAAARYAEVFAGDGARVLGRLLSIAAARRHAPRLVAALRAQPWFAQVSETALYRAIEGARLQTRPDSEALHYVVRGGLCSELLGARLGPGTLERFEISIDARALEVEAGSELIAIPRAPLLAALRRSPNFARTLTQLAATGDVGVELDMIVFDERLGWSREQAGAAIDVLSDSLTRQLGARVGVVRLRPRSEPSPELDHRGFSTTLGYAGAAHLRRELQAHVRRVGLCFDHVLIDTSALPLDDRLRASLWSVVAGLGVGARLHYVFHDPTAFEQLPRRIEASMIPLVELLPVAVLDHRAHARADEEPYDPPLPSGPEGIGARLARLLSAPGSVEGPVHAQLRGESPTRRAWPIDAVRLQLDSQRRELDSESPARWARATAWRRVGVAIAAAGAQSYAALPLLRRLRHAGVPIDVLSGASVGAFIAGFHAAFGERGLALLERSWPRLQALVVGAYLDNGPLTRWLVEASEAIDLADLAIPVIVVSTDADTGVAHHHRVGLLGKACMASGSIPPAMPTFIGDRRLLDGALVEDVPAAILSAAGCDLTIAVQACPPMHDDPRLLPRPSTARARRRRSLSVGLRVWDFGRSHLMLCRLAAERGASPADVVYSASTTASNPGLFVQVPRVIAEASRSSALAHALADALARWEQLCRPHPLALRVELESGRVELGAGITLALDDALRPTTMTTTAIAALSRHAAAAECRLEITLTLADDRPGGEREACMAHLLACAGPDAPVCVQLRETGATQLTLRLLHEEEVS